MVEAALAALNAVLTLERLLFLLQGTAIGLVVGFLPGMSGVTGLALIVPFIFGMDPFNGIAFLIGAHAVTHTSDTFTSVLIGVPGSAGSQATIMDGYPMAQQGRAARALGAAFLASMIGGIIGAFSLLLLIYVARPLVLAIGSPELLILSLIGIATVGMVSTRARLPGLIAAAFGFIIGLVGMAPLDGTFRYTFGQPYLFDGLHIAVVALGLFAIPELIDLLATRAAISKRPLEKGGLLKGAREVLRNKWLVVRSSILGTALGIIPGIGSAVVDWIVYGVTMQTSKNAQEFGRGDIRGVIGPESANNAKDGGTLVPTLLFGIPGSGSMAILLGGLIVLGVQVGPDMVTVELPLTFSIILCLAIASVLATAMCFMAAPLAARITSIEGPLLVPFLLVLTSFAAWHASRHWGDLIAFVAIGVIGWLMKEFGFPRPPTLIAYVLAGNVERYLHISMGRYDYQWMTRPGVLALGLILIFLIGISIIGYIREARRESSGVAK